MAGVFIKLSIGFGSCCCCALISKFMLRIPSIRCASLCPTQISMYKVDRFGQKWKFRCVTELVKDFFRGKHWNLYNIFSRVDRVWRIAAVACVGSTLNNSEEFQFLFHFRKVIPCESYPSAKRKSFWEQVSWFVDTAVYVLLYTCVYI